MRWTPGNRGNIEDYRGRSGMGLRAAPLGIGGLVVLLLLSWFTGVDFLSLVGGGGTVGESARTGAPRSAGESPEEARLVDMVDNVMEDAQNTWRELLGGRYEETRVRLFRDAIDSACGFAQAATGPFYCPADRRVYLDLGFFDELQQRFSVTGDFAQAYVVAHELGHHIQTITGIEAQVRQRQSANPSARNALSVQMELQADCFAGIWGHHAAAGGPRRRRWRRTRSGRHRRGVERGGRHRRRSAPAAGHGPRVAGELHAWILAAAHRLVPSRVPERRPEGLRHVRGGRLTA